jgi:rhamnosyltransferase
MKPRPTVVMRAHNDMPLLGQTLAALARQDRSFELIAFDNASNDGGRELLERHADRVFHVPQGEYIPGRVLNRAMQDNAAPVVVFLNADCEPLSPRWLSSMLSPFEDPHVGAVFGRQLPRADCSPLAAFDTEQAYGDGSRQEAWRNCFSMANCAVRRSLWEMMPFNETLRYSEDIAWSWEVRKSGIEIRYIPEAAVYHSHNYSDEQWRQRQYGEGKAEAAIFPWSPWQRSFFRYSLLPTARQVVRDICHCVTKLEWSGLFGIPGYRYAQMTGRRQGFLCGLRESDSSAHSQPAMEVL